MKSDWNWKNYRGNLDWLPYNTIYLARHGSHAYGTNIATSDEDWRGVAIAPKEYYLGFLNNFEQAVCHEPVDLTVFELTKFVKLAADCNPNVIEILFVDDSDVEICKDNIDCNPGRRLIDMRDLFLTKRVRHTFSGYATAQLKRINTHHHWLMNPVTKKPERTDFGLPDSANLIPSEHLKSMLSTIQKRLDEWATVELSDLPAATRQAIKSQMAANLSAIGCNSGEDLMYAAARSLGASDNLIEAMKRENQYTNALRDYKNYQNWLETRNQARSELEAKYGYDTKHAMHLVRLLRMCREILSGQSVLVKRPDADELLFIRNGGWTYEELIEYAKTQDQEMEQVAADSALPKIPDVKEIDKRVRYMIEQFLFY
jgi:predicted nucleotidyltransferase